MSSVAGPGAGGVRPGDGLEALRSGRIRGEKARLEASTSLLEASFYQELFKAMRATVPEGGMTGGAGQDVFSSLMDQHLAEVSAARGGEDSLGRALYRSLAPAVTDTGGDGG